MLSAAAKKPKSIIVGILSSTKSAIIISAEEKES
jgi:hypothetical protein